MRARWAALGAAVAVTLGAGGITMAGATIGSGERNTFVPVKLCTVFKGSIGPNKKVVVDAKGKCGLGTTFTALQTRVTGAQATEPSGVSLYPAGATKPSTYQLLPRPGLAPSPTGVAVNTSGGKFVVYNRAGRVTITVAVEGYYEHHVHDDRYYTKAQVEASRVVTHTFSPAGIRWIGSNAYSTFNGCQTRPTGATANGYVPLTLPVGATVLSARVAAFDSNTAGATYTVSLWSELPNSVGLTSTPRGNGTGGDVALRTDIHTITPASTWVVQPGETAFLSFSTSAVSANGLCSVQVTYRLADVG